MGFLGDLVNRPTMAIETIKEKRNIWKTAVLIVATGFLMMINFYFLHFTGMFPDIIIFALFLAVLGILLVLTFLLGLVIDLYIFLKVTKYEPAGDVCKTISWCYLVPFLIFHGGLFVVMLLLRMTGTIEWGPYIYDYLKYLCYIWVIGLSIVTIVQHRKEHKIRNMLGFIGIFGLNWLIWVYLNMQAFKLIFTTLVA